MLPIPPAPNVEGYRKSAMNKWLVGPNVNMLRQYMMLPKNVSECKIVILSQIEMNPRLKSDDPKEVLENLKALAIQYYHNTGQHLDLRIDVPKEMLLLSSEDPSPARTKDEFVDSVADDEEVLSEKELERQEKELEAAIKKKEEQKRLRARKAEIEARRRKLQEDAE
jgi:hypothetical protein